MNNVTAEKPASVAHGAMTGALLMLVSGAIAGALASVMIGHFGNYFELSPEAAQAAAEAGAAGTPPPPDVVLEIETAARHNRMLEFALLGGALGALLCCSAAALGAGLLRAVMWLVIGALLGGLFGALGAMYGVEVFDRIEGRYSQLAEMLVVQVGTWSCIGVGVGLAAASVRPSLRQFAMCLAAGIVGGVLANVAQQALLMVFFPMENSTLLVPDGDQSRLVWAVAGGCAIGLTLGRAIPPRPAAPVVPEA